MALGNISRINSKRFEAVSASNCPVPVRLPLGLSLETRASRIGSASGSHHCRCTRRDDHARPALDQNYRRAQASAHVALGPPIFDRNVAAFNESSFAKILQERRQRRIVPGEAELTKPTTGIAVRCAGEANGHRTAQPKAVMNSRRLTRCPYIRGPIQTLGQILLAKCS